ncbi:MAG: hypothetical protein N3E51_04245 [Candidatus Micrarchaeota archaeon]|nr:hypothetical protein [Candidatus Micrarchaeota archaeon]
MAEDKRAEALKKGEVELRVRRAGMFQKLLFRVVKRKTPAGEVPYLFLDRFLDLPELMRIAEEYSLPVEAKNGRVFPKGKKESDFAGIV